MSKRPPARSPPKSLQHVPCKFYRTGQCTAGRNCPFSHSSGESDGDRVICKYFQKGNCKFGARCALAHLLPDGTTGNVAGGQRHHGGNNGAAAIGNGGSRRLQQPPPQIGLPSPQPQPQQQQQYQQQQQQHQQDPSIGIRIIPEQRDRSSGLGSLVQESRRALGPLDAQLPASLDSNGLSYFARHGPVAASVPQQTSIWSADAVFPLSASPKVSSSYAAGMSTSVPRSPSGSPSSSRFGALFQKHKEREALQQQQLGASASPIPHAPLTASSLTGISGGGSAAAAAVAARQTLPRVPSSLNVSTLARRDGHGHGHAPHGAESSKHEDEPFEMDM